MNIFLQALFVGLVVVALPVSAQEADGIICTAQYSPVCGAKQVQCITAPCYPVYQTYGNSCMLGAQNGAFIHDGECTAQETGPVLPTKPYVPPASCTAWYDGCNNCGKDAKGQTMCTERACLGTQAPGYCTAYKANPPVVTPANPPANTGGDTSDALLSIPVIEPTPEPGFLQRLWNMILSWFTWL